MSVGIQVISEKKLKNTILPINFHLFESEKPTWIGLRHFIETLQSCHNPWRCQFSSQVLNPKSFLSYSSDVSAIMTAKPTRYLSSQIEYDFFTGSPTSAPAELDSLVTANKRAKKLVVLNESHQEISWTQV